MYYKLNILILLVLIVLLVFLFNDVSSISIFKETIVIYYR